jgi:hypothetical protein
MRYSVASMVASRLLLGGTSGKWKVVDVAEDESADTLRSARPGGC